MSYWNHRVIRHTTKEGDVWYGIHEVYYSDSGKVGWTENPVKPFGESIEELKADIERMMKALEQPELVDDEPLSE